MVASKNKIAAVGDKVAANKQLQVCAMLTPCPLEGASVGEDDVDAEE